jgi:hypothetical protein
VPSDNKFLIASEILMLSDNRSPRHGHGPYFLRTGLCIGLAGGVAEVGVVWLYSALTDTDAALIARHVASAIRLGDTASVGVSVHMVLAVTLGICLNAVMRTSADRLVRDRLVFPFMIGSLVIIWSINFIVVLPTVYPSFVHLLPFTISLASKMAFGVSAAITFCALTKPSQAEQGPNRASDNQVFSILRNVHPRMRSALSGQRRITRGTSISL